MINASVIIRHVTEHDHLGLLTTASPILEQPNDSSPSLAALSDKSNESELNQ